ncbi:MAG: SRPBCC family protein [Acidimicrobiia bacterium]|nr:SRPBCC family protein [Acidimicrobiia bacterium]
MPRATFSHQAVAAAPAEAVWERLQLAETWANIGPVEDVIESVSREDGQLESFVWTTTVAMKHYTGTAAVSDAVYGQRMTLDLDAREVAGTLEAHLAPNGNGTTIVTVTLEVVSRGTLSTLFFPVVSEAVARGLPDQVDRFAQSLG